MESHIKQKQCGIVANIYHNNQLDGYHNSVLPRKIKLDTQKVVIFLAQGLSQFMSDLDLSQEYLYQSPALPSRSNKTEHKRVDLNLWSLLLVSHMFLSMTFLKINLYFTTVLDLQNFMKEVQRVPIYHLSDFSF